MSHAPIVAFATTKGGSGKSTTCILVAGEIAARGERVLILDTDPQQSAVQWFARCKAANQKPQNIEVESCVGEHALSERLKSLPEDGIVLIDTQGALTPAMSIVAIKADLIVVPSKASTLDVVEAGKFVNYTKNFREGGVRIFLNEVDSIAPNTAAFKEALKYIVKEHIPYFRTMLYPRPLFRLVTDATASLEASNADPAQIRKAKANVAQLMNEILEELSDVGDTVTEDQQAEPAAAVA